MEIYTRRLCGFLSCMFDERFKNCFYTIDGQRHFFSCKLISKVAIPREDMGTIINILNVRICEFKEFSPFFLEKEIEYKEDNKEIFYIYKFKN